MKPCNLLTVGLCLTTAKAILHFMHNTSPRLVCHSRCYFTWFFIHVIGEPCSNPTFCTNSFLKVLLSAIIPLFFCLSEYPIIGSSCIPYFFSNIFLSLLLRKKFWLFRCLRLPSFPVFYHHQLFFELSLPLQKLCVIFFSQSFFPIWSWLDFMIQVRNSKCCDIRGWIVI